MAVTKLPQMRQKYIHTKYLSEFTQFYTLRALQQSHILSIPYILYVSYLSVIRYMVLLAYAFLSTLTLAILMFTPDTLRPVIVSIAVLTLS